MFFVKQKAIVEEKVRKKILHHAQTMDVFSGRGVSRKNTSEVKDLERDSLDSFIQAYIPLGKSFRKCTCYPVGRQLHQRVLCSFGWLCIINTYYITQSLSLLTPLSIQDRSGTLGGERSLLSPVFLNKIRWVKAVKIIQIIKKVYVKQLVRKDPNAD